MENTTVTRAYLADEVSNKIGLSVTESLEIIDILFNDITDHFIQHDNLKITAFGSLNKRFKKQRLGRNPKTKKEAIISARMVVNFNPSRKLKAKINEKMQ